MKFKFLLVLTMMAMVGCGKKETVRVSMNPFDDSEIQERLDDHQARIEALEALSGAMQTQLNSLEFRMTTVENNYVSLSVFNQTLVDLRQEFNTAITNVQTASTVELEAAVALLQTQLTDHEERISDLESLISSLGGSGLDIDDIVQFCPNADEVGIRLSDGRVLAFLQTIECAGNSNNCNTPNSNSGNIKLVKGRLSILQQDVTYTTTSASGNCNFTL